MSITISIGSISVDPRTLDKTTDFNSSTPSDITAQIKDSCSVMSPRFILSASVVDLVQYNYCYVADWGRYYYIENMVTMPGGRTEIICKEDVLTTNADAIKAMQISLARSQSNSNKKMLDSFRPSQVNRQCETIQFKDCHLGANMATDIVYVLTVQGGAH